MSVFRNCVYSSSLAFALVWNAHGQNSFSPGYYEISSGEYSECCGIAGAIRTSLPNDSQRFVRLTRDSQSPGATMTILGADMQTVFSTRPLCPPPESIPFSFTGGLLFPDRIIFHVDPGPNGLYWNYTVSNAPTSLTLYGRVGLARPSCAGDFTEFSHTNVVAALVAPPKLEVKSYSQDGTTLFIQGRAMWQTVVEASSDLMTWVEIAREIMPATKCPICPFIEVQDNAGAGTTPRYYRVYQRP
jgi:hypothetical protein